MGLACVECMELASQKWTWGRMLQEHPNWMLGTGPLSPESYNFPRNAVGSEVPFPCPSSPSSLHYLSTCKVVSTVFPHIWHNHAPFCCTLAVTGQQQRPPPRTVGGLTLSLALCPGSAIALIQAGAMCYLVGLVSRTERGPHSSHRRNKANSSLCRVFSFPWGQCEDIHYTLCSYRI